MYRLKLLGSATLAGPDGVVVGRTAQRHRLALLALLALAGEKGIGREKVVALLWPESDSPHARHRLSDALYVLRQGLGCDPVAQTGDFLWLNREHVRVDVLEFQDALGDGEPEKAVDVYDGPFLDGFHLSGSQPFEDWLESQRQRLANLYGQALESLARRAEEEGDPVRAADHWRSLLGLDPLSSRVAKRLMQALILAGDPANALEVATTHERQVRDDLGIPLPEEILSIVRGLLREGPLSRERVTVSVRPGALGRGPDAESGQAGRWRVAVLPFVALSAGPETGLVSDGMTFDIVNHLAKVRALKVISSTSTMRYKGSDKHLRQIGEELGVDAIVEGDVQRVGERVRINAQLVDARTDEHLWAGQYDRELSDIFGIQSDVATRVAAALEATLTSGEMARIGAWPTRNVEAYSLYLKGRHLWEERGSGIRKGLDLFQQALEVDPDYALAHAGAADCHALLGFFGECPPREAMPRARASASRALKVDAQLAEGHTSMGFVRFYFDWDAAAAEAAFTRATDLNPSYAPAHYFWAGVCMNRGRPEEAILRSRVALDRDPLSPFVNAHFGWMLLGAKKWTAAGRQLEHTLALDPDLPLAHWLMGWAAGLGASPSEAIPHFRTAVERSGGLPWFLGFLGWAYGASGRRAEAESVLARLEAARKTRFVRSLSTALVHTGLGNLEDAVRALERACDERDPWMPSLGIDPFLEHLRPEPAFTALIKRVGSG